MLTKIQNWLSGKKAYIVMIGAIIAAIGGYAEGTLTLAELVTAIFAALGLGATRSAIGKVEEKTGS